MIKVKYNYTRFAKKALRRAELAKPSFLLGIGHFNVDFHRETVEAGFLDRRKKRSKSSINKRVVIDNSIASDVLEFGGKVLFGYGHGRGKKNLVYIKSRPHVSVAKEKLRTGSGSAGRSFQEKINNYAKVYIRA